MYPFPKRFVYSLFGVRLEISLTMLRPKRSYFQFASLVFFFYFLPPPPPPSIDRHIIFKPWQPKHF